MPKKSRADIISSDDAMLNEVVKVIRLKEGQLAIGDSVDQQGRNNMRTKGIFVTLFVTANLAGAAFALAQGNGNGRGNGGGGGGGGEEPAPPFEPAIAYYVESNRATDIRISNVAGDQACLVRRFTKGDPNGDLRAFAISGATRRMAYSLGGDLYVATWTDDPCSMSFNSEPVLEAQMTYEGVGDIHSLDFSPDGTKLVWTLNALADDNSRDIFIYDLGDSSFERISTDYRVRYPRFSPQYLPDSPLSQELFFAGYPDSGGLPYSIYGYNLSDGAVRTIASGLNFNVGISVSHPSSTLGVRIAAKDNDSGYLHQYDADGNLAEPMILDASSEMAYSCDNSQIIYRYAVNWRNNDAVVSARDGSSARTYSTADLRDFEWIC